MKINRMVAGINAAAGDWIIFALFVVAGVLFAGWFVFRVEEEKRLLKVYLSGADSDIRRPGAPGYWKTLAARSNMKLDGNMLSIILVGACTGGYAVGYTLTASVYLSLLFVPAGPLLFWQYLAARADATDWVSYNQTADFCKLMANAVSAGQSPETAFCGVVPKLGEPLRGLLEVAARRVEKGEPLIDALLEARKGLRVTPFYLFIVATRLWKKRGGDLAASYMSIHDVVVKSANASEKVRAVSRSGVRRGLILTGGPILAVFGGRIGAPDYMEPLFSTTPGLIMLAVAVGLVIGAWVMIRKITTLKLM